MTTPDPAKRTMEIVAAHIGRAPEAVKPGHSLTGDLGLDSLDVLEISYALEEAFRVEIPLDMSDGWQAVGDIAETMRTLTQGAAA